MGKGKSNAFPSPVKLAHELGRAVRDTWLLTVLLGLGLAMADIISWIL